MTAQPLPASASAPLQDASAPQPIATAAARGVLWALLATLAAKLSWLAALTVLARLLRPAEFGLFSFGLVFVTFVETVGDLGAGAALIYTRRAAERAAQAAFVLNLAMGAVWFAMAQLAAPAIAGFFHDPRGEPVVRALAFVFLLKGLGNTHDALLRKRLRFRARLLPELALALGKGALAVALALAGLGVWSLVWGQLLGVALWTVALWKVVPWRPALAWPRGELGPLLRFGRGIVAVDVLAGVLHHADQVVVGRISGTAALGLYQLAGRVPEMTVTLAVWVTSHVLFPAFARLYAAGEELREGFLAALRWIPMLTLPMAAGLWLLAEPLLLTLFGGQWAPAAPVLRMLAVYTGLRSLGSHAGDLLKAVGRPGLLAGLGIGKAALLLPALVMAGERGPVAVAAALAAVTGLTALLNLGVVAWITGVSPVAMARALAPSVVATAAMAALVALALAAASPLLPAVELAAGVALGVVAYLAVLRAIAPAALREAVRTLRGARPSVPEGGRAVRGR